MRRYILEADTSFTINSDVYFITPPLPSLIEEVTLATEVLFVPAIIFVVLGVTEETDAALISTRFAVPDTASVAPVSAGVIRLFVV